MRCFTRKFRAESEFLFFPVKWYTFTQEENKLIHQGAKVFTSNFKTRRQTKDPLHIC